MGAFLRYENFDDLQGQRTGFDTMYTAVTTGLIFKPRKDMFLRSEIRYDIASTGKPFNNATDNQIFTGAVDFIMRW